MIEEKLFKKFSDFLHINENISNEHLDLFLNMVSNAKSYLYDNEKNIICEIININNNIGFLVSNFNEVWIYEIKDNWFLQIEDEKERKKLLKKFHNIKKILTSIRNLLTWNERVSKKLFSLYLNYKAQMANLFSILKFYIQQFRFFTRNQSYYDLIASYIISTWVKEAFTRINYFIIFGDKGSGKTTLLETFGMFCYRSLISGDISVASLARLLDKHSVSLLLDEFGENEREDNRELIRILKNGSQQGINYIRYEKESGEVGIFNVFGHKVLVVGIDRDLPEDIRDRGTSITCLREDFVAKEIPKPIVQDFVESLSAFRIFMLMFNNSEKLKKAIEKVESHFKQLDSRLANNIKNLILFSTEIKNTLELIKDYYEEKIEELKESESYDVLIYILEFLKKSVSIDLEAILKGLKEGVEIELMDFVYFYLMRKTGVETIDDIKKKISFNDIRRIARRIGSIIRNKIGARVERKEVEGKTRYTIRIKDERIVKRMLELYNQRKNVVEIFNNFINNDDKELDKFVLIKYNINEMEKKILELKQQGYEVIALTYFNPKLFDNALKIFQEQLHTILQDNKLSEEEKRQMTKELIKGWKHLFAKIFENQPIKKLEQV